MTSLELPIRLRSDRPMSDEELMRFGRENRPLRMEREPNGEILVMTPTGFGTTVMNQRICYFLAGSLEKVGTMTPDQEENGFAPFAPDFVVELRSSSDRLADIRAKIEEWIANGVELAWLIDPKRRVVEIDRHGEAVEICENPTSVQGTGCVSGFYPVMGRVWG